MSEENWYKQRGYRQIRPARKIEDGARLHFLFHVIHIVAPLASNFPPRFSYINFQKFRPRRAWPERNAKSHGYMRPICWLSVFVQLFVVSQSQRQSLMVLYRRANFPMHGSLKIHTVISRTDLHNTTANLAITRARISWNCWLLLSRCTSLSNKPYRRIGTRLTQLLPLLFSITGE